MVQPKWLFCCGAVRHVAQDQSRVPMQFMCVPTTTQHRRLWGKLTTSKLHLACHAASMLAQTKWDAHSLRRGAGKRQRQLEHETRTRQSGGARGVTAAHSKTVHVRVTTQSDSPAVRRQRHARPSGEVTPQKDVRGEQIHAPWSAVGTLARIIPVKWAWECLCGNDHVMSKPAFWAIIASQPQGFHKKNGVFAPLAAKCC